MKKMRFVVVFALCVIAGMGCGKKDAEANAVAEQEEAPKKTGNVVLDNISSEPDQ